MLLPLRTGFANAFDNFNELSKFMRAVIFLATLVAVAHAIAFASFSANPSSEIAQKPTGMDTLVYVVAGQDFLYHGDLYDVASPMMQVVQNFRYHPFVAEVFGWMNATPESIPWLQAVINLSYIAGFFLWYVVICSVPDLKVSAKWLILILGSEPLAVMYYGNIGLMLVPASAIIFLLLDKRKLVLAGILIALVAMVKPQWALFPTAGFGLWWLYGKSKSPNAPTFAEVFQVVASAVISYMWITLLFLFTSGDFNWALRMLQDYFYFLVSFSARHPVFGTEAMFNTEQNDLLQTFARYFGTEYGNVVAHLAKGIIVGAVAACLVQIQKRKNFDAQSYLSVTLMAYVVLTLFLGEIVEAILIPVVILFLGQTQNAKKLVLIAAVMALTIETGSILTIVLNLPTLTLLLPVTFMQLVAVLSSFVVVIYTRE